MEKKVDIRHAACPNLPYLLSSELREVLGEGAGLGGLVSERGCLRATDEAPDLGKCLRSEALEMKILCPGLSSSSGSPAKDPPTLQGVIQSGLHVSPTRKGNGWGLQRDTAPTSSTVASRTGESHF